MILVTGSEGLIGTALCRLLGSRARGFDLRGAGGGDVRDPVALAAASEGCEGIVHLAAVSRVIWGERDPDGCRATNVGGTRNVLDAAKACGAWVMYASSREVYGRAATLPVTEDAPPAPVNVYGETKVRAEELVAASGVSAAVVRLSNVYGSVADHPDRVVPAFARAAARGAVMRVDGEACTFDFTHVEDVVRGLARVVEQLDAGERVPTLHFVSGRATSLGELARIANRDGRARVEVATPRSFDVPHFVGDPARAERVLGWRATTPLVDGVARLVAAFR